MPVLFLKEVFFLIQEINRISPTYEVLGVVDIKDKGKEVIDGARIIGDDTFLFQELRGVGVAIAQGFPVTRERVYQKYRATQNFEFPNLIHPTPM